MARQTARLKFQGKEVGTPTPSIGPHDPPSSGPMIGENRQLVTDEPVEFEK